MTYQPEAFEVLAERAFKAIQDAHNSGYILGNENAEARIIKLLEEALNELKTVMIGLTPRQRELFQWQLNGVGQCISLIKGEQK